MQIRARTRTLHAEKHWVQFLASPLKGISADMFGNDPFLLGDKQQPALPETDGSPSIKAASGVQTFKP